VHMILVSNPNFLVLQSLGRGKGTQTSRFNPIAPT
jgi:hypothetical protein